MSLNLDAMLPNRTQDQRARQDFVKSFRRHLALKVRSGLDQVYEARVKPKFESEHGREPQARKEVRREMTQDPYYQFWSAMQRESQVLMYDSITDALEPQREQLIERAKELGRKAQGTLELHPELEIPKYHTAADIHLMPGGFHTEVVEDDVSAGVLYDAGLDIYAFGLMGPKKDLLVRVLIDYYQKEYPDHPRPTKILDMGCAVGNSTTSWKEEYPDAEVHGIDVGAPCLRHAHARAESMGIPIHYKQENAEKTHYPDESFDLVVSVIMFHETSQSALPNILGESYRLLKPGGMMLHLDVPGGADPFGAFVMEWECKNTNENFANMYRATDMAATAIKMGFEEGKARNEGAAAKSFSPHFSSWPVVVGEK